MKFKLTQKVKDQLWWLIISVDYDASRIVIADHNLTDEIFTLWLEDKHDFKNTLDECLELQISLTDLAKFIKTEKLNSYEGQKVHPTKNYIYNATIEINEPIAWYKEDATPVNQKWARESLVKAILVQLIEQEEV